MEQKRAIHLKEGQQLLDVARETGQKVRVKAWTMDGRIVEYNGWLVSSSSWRGGWHRLLSPVSREIRTVLDIMIFEINGHKIYL